jgi:hypothetical protein
MMQRRNFLSGALTAATAAALASRASAQSSAAKPPVRLGVDIYSLEAQNWTPFQSLDYCAML